MPHYMFCPRKKIISRTFKISGALIVKTFDCIFIIHLRPPGPLALQQLRGGLSSPRAPRGRPGRLSHSSARPPRSSRPPVAAEESLLISKRLHIYKVLNLKETLTVFVAVYMCLGLHFLLIVDNVDFNLML